MNNKLLASLFSVCILSTTTAFAEQAPNWSYVEAGYVKGDADALSNANFTGLHLEGSVSLNDSIFVLGRYRDISDSFDGLDVEVNQISLGLGYHHALEKNTDFYTTASFIQLSSEASFNTLHESSDNNGYEVSVGVRSMLTDSFEMMTAVSYADVDGSDTSFKFGAFYHFTSNVAVGANYEFSTEINYLTFSARYSF